MTESLPPRGPMDHVLDSELERVLTAPEVSEGLHRRLHAALARAADTDIALLRARIESERREKLAELDANYIRIKRQTLGTMIGGAFAAGAAVTVVMPWLQSHFGAVAPLILAFAGAAVGLAIGLSSWRARRVTLFGG